MYLNKKKAINFCDGKAELSAAITLQCHMMYLICWFCVEELCIIIIIHIKIAAKYLWKSWYLFHDFLIESLKCLKWKSNGFEFFHKIVNYLRVYFDQLNASFLNIFISVHLFIKKTYWPQNIWIVVDICTLNIKHVLNVILLHICWFLFISLRTYK